jgi:hypothetical protein
MVNTFLFKDRKNSTTMYVRYMDHRDVLGTPATDGDTVLRRKFRNRRVAVEFRTSPGRPCTRRSQPHNGSLQSLRADATRQRRKNGHRKRHALSMEKTEQRRLTRLLAPSVRQEEDPVDTTRERKATARKPNKARCSCSLSRDVDP